MVNRSINVRAEVELRVKEALLNKSNVLDLRDIDLTYLPGDIFLMQSLKELYLSSSSLKIIDERIIQLTNLEIFSLSRNYDEGIYTKHDFDHYSNISYNLPLLDFELLRDTEVMIPRSLWLMKQLRVLRLEGVKLKELPFEIGNMSNLEVLIFESKDIVSFPKSIKYLINLKILVAKVSDKFVLPSEITQLEKLELLSLSDFGYRYPNLEESVKNHIYLKEKGFSTMLGEVFGPDSYGNIKIINKLDYNIINKPIINSYESVLIENNINIEIAVKLKALRYLRLSGFSITEIPKSISLLDNLEFIDLSYNIITSIPKEISNCALLKEINLQNNNIKYGLQYIGNLPNLKKLFMAENKLEDLSKVDNFPELEWLDVRKNNIQSISEKIFKYLDYAATDPVGLKKIELSEYGDLHFSYSHNPIKSPPLEIIAEGRQALIDYFESLKGKTMPLNEVKVLLVGDGGAGKTSLVKRMLGEEFSTKEEQTQGININNWTLECNSEDMNVRLWDFGGQEIMHATHQFFLSKRSLYILVLDGRKEEKTEYWLKHIESFGGGSSVLVVLNKMDENPSFDVNRSFLQEKYSGIKGFYRTSCSSGEGILSLLDGMKEELTNAELRQSKWAKSWFDVKEKLEDMEEPFIDLETYSEICSGNGVEDTAQDTLVGFLHDLGIAMHFKDLNLQGVHVLEPRWVTQAVYKIINSEVLAKTKGILQFDKLDEILKKKEKDDYVYKPDKYSYIVNLMKKFELCYSLDESSVLIPDLLEVEQTNFKHDSDDLLSFYFEYEFLPRSIMPRFMVQLHKDIRDEHRWRTGVVLEDNTFDSVATIVADIEKRRISISVEGAQKRDYFAIIRKTFNDIHKGFKKLKVNEWVPLPGYPEFAVTYRNLVGHEAAGRETYYDGELLAEFSVSRLLDGIEKPGKRTNIINEEQSNKHSLGLTTIEVFLASSSELEEERNKVEIWVRRQNDELIRNGFRLKLHLWEDFLDAMSKTRLQDEYNKAVLRSDIMLCLFATKIGRFTKEEFEVAYNGFKESGRPRFIYTYFKEAQIKVTDETAISNSNELNKFRKSLVELGHFPSFFKSTDDLEKQLSTQVVKILKEYSTES